MHPCDAVRTNHLIWYICMDCPLRLAAKFLFAATSEAEVKFDGN